MRLILMVALRAERDGIKQQTSGSLCFTQDNDLVLHYFASFVELVEEI